MICGRTRDLVMDEMLSMLRSIEIENSQFERERNELKSLYHSRPQEERNIVKDILVMHTDFDGGVNKLKGIVDELVTIPTEKTVTTEKAEDLASQIVVMQASLLRKHDILQRCLAQKINYQRLKDDAQSSILEETSENDQIKFKCLEIENFENYNIYSKKVKFLNSEIQRLKAIICNPSNINLDDALFTQEDSNITTLNEKKALLKFQQVFNENKRIEVEIGRISSLLGEKNAYLKEKLLLDEKRRRIFDLKKKLSLLNKEIGKQKPQPIENDCSEKIKRLDSIIGRRTVFQLKPSSPTSTNSRGPTLLQDIEESLNRVKSITSSIPRN
ncbi:hypothetical protein SteCoe_36901 [Stentor coeruleus]|uniref:DUF4201 domain-containing protein n=1 Tax=Stentor coeruleus TaxID=5963 RepID=A0A1R2AP57_9CILI|nr:hypothetical protein SteCoe_36901 [Stentor coeruleus]